MTSPEVSNPELWARLLEDIEEKSAPTRLAPGARDAYAALTAAMEHHRPACAGDDRFTARSRLKRDLVEICKACPIQRECGTYAELAQPPAGYWAGRSYTKEDQ